MFRLTKRTKGKLGQAPGELTHVSDIKAEKVKLTVIDYGPEHYERREVSDVAECLDLKDKNSVTWINVDGLHDTEVVRRIGDNFGVHPLIQEDILHAGQRAKLEEGPETFFVVLDMLYLDEAGAQTKGEQLSLILGPRFVITFQERPGDVLGPVRKRLEQGVGRLRKAGPDYLFYALIDCVIDHYFVVLESLGERLEAMEDRAMHNPSNEVLRDIHLLKREVLQVRKAVWPVRELVANLQRAESPLMQDATRVFWRDAYDHIIQIVDSAEALRDVAGGMIDVYLSSVSNRANAVMQVLTIIATIFIPLTFIAGIYGMNFEYMPELQWEWSYPFIWAFMIGLAVTMLALFRRKRWL